MYTSLLLAAAAAAAYAAPAPASGAGTHKFTSARRSLTNADGTVNEQALIASLSKTLVKYGHAALPADILSRRRRKRDTGTVPLTDQTDSTEDVLYYGDATVGSETFTIDFDTGSADLFIPGPDCTSDDGCTGTVRYDNSGQDQGNTTSVTYGSGSIAGENYKDAVTVGGLTVENQGFISLTTATGFSSSAAAGLMGMGFSSIAQSGFPTFVENLIAQGALTSNEFSFYLGREVSGTTSASELTIGGADTSRYTGTPVAVPVTDEGYWQVAVDSMSVDGEAVLLTSGQAAIDTGTTLVLGPTIAALPTMALVPGAVPIPLASGSLTMTLWAYPCNTSSEYIPSIEFNGQSFQINPLDFSLGTLADGGGLLAILDSILGLIPIIPDYCLAGLGAYDIDPVENLYVVGDVFLKNWYSIYSYDGPSVSFAPAVNNQ